MTEVRKKRVPIAEWNDIPWAVNAKLYRFEGTDNGAVVTDGAVIPVGDYHYTLKEVYFLDEEWFPGDYYRSHLSPVEVEHELDRLEYRAKELPE